MSIRQITKQFALAFILSASLVVPAQAQNHDSFAHNTPSLTPQPKQTETEKPSLSRGMPITGPKTPVVTWFESFDSTVYFLKPTSADKITLNRPLDREAERVQTWIDTANRISKNYKLLAMTLKQMRVPEEAPEVREFRDLSAQWYGDVAGLYEDLIVPRKPPKTQEELDDQIADFRDRATSLGQVKQQLHKMEVDIRNAHGVHGNQHSDALFRYVRHEK